ncbi:MAG: ferredoxin family protein [Nitrospinae bacterium]|nr:ferredoxin family protein [Nitrospinota bacterium]
MIKSMYSVNTLRYDAELCVNCGVCIIVCPHDVFAEGEDVVSLARPEDCMECGACQKNCPVEAIAVDSGVGCAAALIGAAVKGGEPACGCGEDSSSSSCC